MGFKNLRLGVTKFLSLFASRTKEGGFARMSGIASAFGGASSCSPKIAEIRRDGLGRFGVAGAPRSEVGD